MGEPMEKFYISFGQGHAHAVGGKTFDRDCLCLIEADYALGAAPPLSDRTRPQEWNSR